jgi:hypothetical protein
VEQVSGVSSAWKRKRRLVCPSECEKETIKSCLGLLNFEQSW